MKIKTVIFIIVIVCFNYNGYTISAIDYIDELAKKLNKARIHGTKPIHNGEDHIETIEKTLTGHAGGIDFAKAATEDERNVAFRSTLTTYLYDQERHVPLALFQNVLFKDHPRYYGHLACVTIMHLAAHFMAHDKRVYCWPQQNLISEISNTFHQFSLTADIEAGFKMYLLQLEDKHQIIQKALGNHYYETLYELTQGYSDIPQNWIVDLFYHIRENFNIKQQELPPFDIIIPNHDQNPIIALLTDPSKILPEIIR